MLLINVLICLRVSCSLNFDFFKSNNYLQQRFVYGCFDCFAPNLVRTNLTLEKFLGFSEELRLKQLFIPLVVLPYFILNKTSSSSNDKE